MTRLAVLCVALAGCRHPAETAGAEPLTVFAASSLSEVLPSLAEAWRQQGGGVVSPSFDSSSRLAKQIEVGAPADVFVSADEGWMNYLADRGRIDRETRFDLVSNVLVYVVPAEAGTVPDGAGEIAAGPIGRIGVGGESVPAGRYARQALKHAGVWDAVEPRIVEGDNVRTVLGWVAAGEIDGGVVYVTDARAEPRVKVAFAFTPDSHESIRYPAAVTVAAGSQGDEARAFLAFCRSEDGRRLLDEAGFAPVVE